MKKILYTFLILCVSLIFSTCQTSSPATENNKLVIREGKIVSYRVFDNLFKKNANNIILKGGKYLSPFGKTGALYAGIDYYMWSGSINYGNIKQPISIHFFLTKIGDFASIYVTTINKLPDNYKFKKVSIGNDRIEKKDMPFLLTEISIDNNLFSILVSGGSDSAFGSDSKETRGSLMRLADQKLLITDKTGAIYAECNKDSYKIFKSHGSLSLESIQLSAAIFGIIHKICVDNLYP